MARAVTLGGGGDPCAGLAGAALVAGGAEVPGLAGEGEELFVAAIGVMEAGEAGGEIAAAEEGADGGKSAPCGRLRGTQAGTPMPHGRNGPIVRRWCFS
jgi:hypothetical protein